MLTYPQAILFGIVQGITELFPISSLGHSVVLPRLLGWDIDQSAPFFLTFLVLTHLATAIVLLLFFRKDWVRIVTGLLRSLKEREIRSSDSDAKLAWLLIVATIPAGVLGLLLEEPLQKLFASPQLVAFVLILNGLLLLGAEKLQRRTRKIQHVLSSRPSVARGEIPNPKTAQNGSLFDQILGMRFFGFAQNDNSKSDERIAKLSWMQAVVVGLLQAIALIPGFSRTGASLTGGLLNGLSHEDAARFSFLLATPIIGAAAVLKLSELVGNMDMNTFGPMLVGAIFAGIFAYLSVKFLVKYFETKKMWPFGVYCIVVGAVLSVLFLR
jgi:undecaprenyl-diphosphatase